MRVGIRWAVVVVSLLFSLSFPRTFRTGKVTTPTRTHGAHHQVKIYTKREARRCAYLARAELKWLSRPKKKPQIAHLCHILSLEMSESCVRILHRNAHSGRFPRETFLLPPSLVPDGWNLTSRIARATGGPLRECVNLLQAVTKQTRNKITKKKKKNNNNFRIYVFRRFPTSFIFRLPNEIAITDCECGRSQI